jgi:hypothetical protein
VPLGQTVDHRVLESSKDKHVDAEAIALFNPLLIVSKLSLACWYSR